MFVNNVRGKLFQASMKATLTLRETIDVLHLLCGSYQRGT